MAKIMQIARISWILIFSLTAVALAASVTMYVKSPTAELKSSTDLSGQVVATLNRGTKVSAGATTGNWTQVTAEGKKGFVYKFKLSKSKPSSGDSTLASMGGGGASAREGSTATSIRGLSPTSEKYAGRSKIDAKHVEMVKHMESQRVTQVDVESFLKAGKLGEYAEAK